MWEQLILTATNSAQAVVFESHLARLRRAKVLAPETQTLVVSDPDGQRIGSGGATLNALSTCFPNGINPAQKTLILHAGGDSQRIPHQSLLGKLFAPLLAPDFSVFESIYQVLNQIGQQLNCGVVVACGDTPLRFSSLPQLPSQKFDVLGIGYWGDLALGTQHGVYQFEVSKFKKNELSPKVERVWQKASIDILKQFCDTDQRIAVDTGILIFQDQAIDRWQKWINQIEPDAFLDLYNQLLPELVEDPSINFRLWTPKQLQFFHSGTTRQYFDLISNSSKIVNFIIPLVEPTNNWVKIAYATDDNPKKIGGQATIFGQPIYQWLNQNHLSAWSIWPNEVDRSLWNAQLFPIREGDQDNCDELSENVVLPSWYLEPNTNWLQSQRLSIGEAMKLANRQKAFQNDQRTKALALVSRILVEIEADHDFDPEINQILTPTGSYAFIDGLTERLATVENLLHQSRLHKIISDVADKMGNEVLKNEHLKLAFEAIGQSVQRSIVLSQSHHLSEKIQFSSDKIVNIQLPVRMDLAGGWTDTPPYSLERGGSVVNMALLLNGNYPIRVQARWLDERVVKFHSIDQKQQVEIRDFERLRNRPKIGDPLALPHATLLAGDILSVLNLLNTVGLEIITDCNVPMGSGLGTSSILAAGLIMATWELTGHQWSQEQLFNQVLYVEQLLGSGGGWQDQVGGIVGGVKLTTTERGMPQLFSVQQIPLSDSFHQMLRERMVLAYTGKQRIAKNILDLVVADWLSRRADLVETLTNLRTSAYQMAAAIQNDNLEEFGRLLAGYFESKKVLNPETTNPLINRLINPSHCLGWNIAGAGGGGFLVLLAKDANSRYMIEQHLINHSATVYDWDLANGYVIDSSL